MSLLPGVIRRWKILRVTGDRPRLDGKSVAALEVDRAWDDYSLPEERPVANWWLDQERRRGVAVALQDSLGPAKSFLAVADLPSRAARSACINLGGAPASVWLNGKRLYGLGDPNRGWHPGAWRIPVRLQPGTNRLVVESGGRFFASVTETADG